MGASIGIALTRIVMKKRCGMDVATLEHIFELFFTAKDEGKGTGLALDGTFSK